MKIYTEKDNYEMIVSELKIGDIVSFRLKKSDYKNIKGEVRDFYIKKNKFYIKIYSFFSRKEFKFILTNDLKLINIEKNKKRIKRNYNNFKICFKDNEAENKKEPHNKLLNIYIKIVTIFTIFIFIITSVPDLKIYFFPFPYKYEKFLSKKFSIKKLYSVVVERIIYIPDINDEWMTPQYAWDNRYGDCEEYATVISDYLNHHGIENYVAGLNTRILSIGHAVVFAKINNIFYIMDPTRAVEKMGIRKLNNITNLHDAIMLYSVLPVCIYKIPSFNNEKKIAGVVY